MKLLDLFFPVDTIAPERITEQIKLTYKDVTNKPISAPNKLKAVFASMVLFAVFAGIGWAALRRSSIPAFYQVVYMLPFVGGQLLFICLAFIVPTGKNLAGVVGIHPITLFAILIGLLLLLGEKTMQGIQGVILYYALLCIHFIVTLVLYRLDYRKFPEIAYKNSGKKKTKWWLAVLIFYPLGFLLPKRLLMAQLAWVF